MATNKRNFPNDYFAWYSDDTRLAVVARVLTNEVNANSSSDMYDTYTGMMLEMDLEFILIPNIHQLMILMII